MMRSKYQGRFSRGGSSELGEDINPSGYIVNLADCMLVLACGFMVAMVASWGIDLSQMATSEISDADMQEIEADVVPEDLETAGSDFMPAGTVYYNPTTGSYYILKDDYELDEAITEEDRASESTEFTGDETETNAQNTESNETG